MHEEFDPDRNAMLQQFLNEVREKFWDHGIQLQRSYLLVVNHNPVIKRLNSINVHENERPTFHHFFFSPNFHFVCVTNLVTHTIM